MTRDEAKQCWLILSAKTGEPDSRGWGEQFVELTRVLRNGTAVEQARRLHGLYRLKGPLPSTQEMMVTRYETQLLSQMANVLKRSLGSVKSVLHREQPAFAGESPYRPKEAVPAKPKSLREWREAAGFYVYGSGLVLGESPGSGDDNGGDISCTLYRPALNGAWLVLNRPEKGGTLFVAVQFDHAEEINGLLNQSKYKRLGLVFVNGGTTAAVDAEVRDDPWFRRDFEAGETNGRGFIVNLGGDGACEWIGAFDGDRLCMVATHVPA